MPITTIISDIMGVLLLKNPSWDGIKRYETYLALEPGSLTKALFNTSEDEQAIVGHISQQELMQSASRALDIPEQLIAAFVEDMWSNLQLNHELATFLSQKRPQYTVTLVSNAWSNARNDCNRLFQLHTYVDNQIFSAEEQLAKPDKRIYQLALKRLKVLPENVLFIDDRYENIIVAQQLGMHTLHFKDNQCTLAELKIHLVHS